MTFITHGFGFQCYRTYERGYETSGSPLRFMLRRSSLVECVSVLHGTSVCLLYASVSELLMVLNVYLGFFDKHGCTYWRTVSKVKVVTILW
jgi:hypothetical protein